MEKVQDFEDTILFRRTHHFSRYAEIFFSDYETISFRIQSSFIKILKSIFRNQLSVRY
jgi:hypothetical protein